MRNNFDKHRGAISELIASAWLLTLGYEVFRNVPAHGDVDIVGWKDGEHTSFDVKTISKRSSHKNIIIRQSQHDRKVKLIFVYDDGTCEILEPRVKPPSIKCKRCGVTLSPRVSTTIFCSQTCSTADYRSRHPKNPNSVDRVKTSENPILE